MRQNERNKLIKNLFLYLVGLRDLERAKASFTEIKTNVSVGELTTTANLEKLFFFVICYGRIFHKCYHAGKLKIEDLCDVNPLTYGQSAMHRCLMELRDQSYAHNDAIRNQLVVSFNKVKNKTQAIAQISYHLPCGINRRVTFSLFKKLQKNLNKKRDEVLKKLYPIPPKLITICYDAKSKELKEFGS
jgi:hypothetical protein